MLVKGLALWRDADWMLWNIESRLRERLVQSHNMFADKPIDSDDITYLPNPDRLSDGRRTDDLNREAAPNDLLESARKHMFGE